MLKIIKKTIVKNSKIIRYILILFVISRVILTVIGVTSKLYFQDIHPNTYTWNYSKFPVLNIWGIWDSGYYLDLAKRGYSDNQNFQFQVSVSPNSFGKHQTNYGFFPLYPIFIRGLSYVFNNYFVSGIITSNIALLLSAFTLYKIIIDVKGEEIAKRTVKYLFLFPTSFIFSGVFSESLLLLFILTSIYFAERKRFLLSGLLGCGATLTKLVGIISIVPILLKSFLSNYKKVRYWTGLLLIPISLFLLMTYFYVISGDFFKYFSVKSLGWDGSLQNPLKLLATLLYGLQSSEAGLKYFSIPILFIIAEISLIISAFKKITFDYWLFWLILFSINLIGGLSVALSMPRHSIILFPQYIYLSLVTSKSRSDKFLTVLFIGLQIFFMALWVNGLVII